MINVRREGNLWRHIFYQPDRGTGATYYLLVPNSAPLPFDTLDEAVSHRAIARCL